MAINFKQIKDAQWRENLYKSVRDANNSMIERFTFADLYPAREIEQPDGAWKEVKQVQPHQQLIHNGFSSISNKKFKYCLFNSGYGAGKSLCMNVQMLWYARKYPGIKLVCCAPYDYYFDEFIWPTRREVLPDDDPLIQDLLIGTRRIIFKNGSEWYFKAYDDASRIRGWEAHIIWIEEGSELCEGNNPKARAIWDALVGRHRAPGNYPRVMYVSQNAKGHNWSWSIFVKPSLMKDDPKSTWLERPKGHPDCPEGDNPKNPDGSEILEWEYEDPTTGDIYYTISTDTMANRLSTPGYIASMISNYGYNPEMLARNIKGHFNPIHSLIYDEPNYSLKTHIVPKARVLEAWELHKSDEYDFPRDWPRWVGIDCAGVKSPWAIEFYIQTPDDELLCYDEIYRTARTWDEIADEILDRTDGLTNVQYWIDPVSSQHGQGPNTQKIIEEFTLRGLPCHPPRFYKKAAAIEHVKSFLKPDRYRPHPYLPDFPLEEDELTPAQKFEAKGRVMYALGAPKLMYLSDPSAIREKNANGYLCPANIAEKAVWRIDDKKMHPPKEQEEGLSPQVQEKPVDRDDHAQTAEMFALMGYTPLPRSTRHIKYSDDIGSPNSVYHARKKRWRE